MLEFLKNGQGKVLNLFINNPERKFYLREVARVLDESVDKIQYAVNVLIKHELLLDERRGNLRLFKLNKAHPLFPEIKSMIAKTMGAEKYLKELADATDGIECAFIYGSYARNDEVTTSDIDLFVVGENIDQDIFVSRIYDAQKKIGKEINYQINTAEEFRTGITEKNNFITNIVNNPVIILKGDLKKFTT
jgi:predicted nucleotidyltransferase